MSKEKVPVIADLGREYTQLVSDLLSKGYTISLSTVERDDVARRAIDFVSNKNPDKVIRLWRIYSYENVLNSCVDVVIFSIREYDKSRRRFYMDEGNQIVNKTFYSFKNKKDETMYFLSEKDYKRVLTLRKTRERNKYDVFNLDKVVDVKKVSPKFKELILNKIKQCRSMKRAKFDVVKCIHLYYNKNRNRLSCDVRWNDDTHHGTIHI